MRIMEIWCQGKDDELADQAVDARWYGLDFGDVIETSTPHLYISALPFTQSGSFISKRFYPMYPKLLNVEGGQEFDSPLERGLVKRNTSSASSLAFSPEGKYIATGFNNGEFWFWDYDSGEILYRWEAWKRNRWNPIVNIVFSPNGQLVYCSFANGHIRIWDVKTNQTIDDAHQDILHTKVYDCTISSDGHYIVFVSPREHGGRKLLLCDRTSRQKLKEFNISSTEFALEGDMLGFINRSKDLCLWDIHRQTHVHSWKAHLESRLALSDRQITFSQKDGSIQVWGIHPLTMVCKIQTTFKRHFSFKFRFAGDRHLLIHSNATYIIWDIPAEQAVVESAPGIRILSLVVSLDAKYVAMASDGTIHVRPLDTPIQWKTLTISYASHPFKAWMRGRYLVWVSEPLLYSKSVLLLVSDTTTMNSIVFQAKSSSGSVAISPKNEHVYVAVATAHGLCVWNDVDREFVLDESTDVTLCEFSPLGDRLIYAAGESVKIWDVEMCTLIERPLAYADRIRVRGLSLPTTGDNFMLAYNSPRWDGGSKVQVQDIQSYEDILKRPFKSNLSAIDFVNLTLKLSADETKIILMQENGVEILDAVTGKCEFFRPYGTPIERHQWQLSPSGKYIAWRGDNKLEIWDICIGTDQVLYQLLSNWDLNDFSFSDDSARIVTLYSIDHRYHIDVWDLSTGKKVRKGIQIYANYCKILSLNGNNLIISSEGISQILNLGVCLLMSPLYENPNDQSVGFRETQTLATLTPWDRDMLDYALIAWNKALFSMGAEISEDGWILGPDGELLVWIPDKRRSTLWRPCMTHISARHVTKLNFDGFVHGARWMECKGDL